MSKAFGRRSSSNGPNRHTRRMVGGCALLVAMAALLTSSAAAADTLRIATLVPKRSSWGKVVHVWQKALKKKTQGKLEVDVYYNGVQGMEGAMVSKMRSGQLDGALLSSAGLSEIDRNIMVLQLPGMIDDWATLDRVRHAMDADLKGRFAKKGFSLVAWSDVGLVRGFSKGFAPRTPHDLEGRQPLVWRNDPITPVLYQTIGGVVPSPLSPTEVLPALRAGRVDFLLAPAVAAEQLQWTPHLEYVTRDVTAVAIGGTVIKQKRLDKLPADLRRTFLALTDKMAKAQARRVRKDDASTYARLKKSSTVVKLNASERAAWSAVEHEAIDRLGRGTFDKSLIARVQKLAGGA